MPGRSPYQAYQAFVEPLARALSCVARAKLQTQSGGESKVGGDFPLYLNRGEPVKLNGRVRLELDVRMRFQIIRDEACEGGPFRVTTLKYNHLLARQSGEAVLNFHWHPGGNSHEDKPHLHVGTNELANDAVLSTKLHVPTGRVSVERVIRAAIELGVEPLVDDWQKVLNSTEGPFIRHRSWH